MQSTKSRSNLAGSASLGQQVTPTAVPQAAAAEYTKRQILWDRRMQTATGPRRRYQKTVVLLVSFKQTDLKNLHNEVDELGQVFVEEYGFKVDRALLGTDNAQKELLYFLAKFVMDHDEKNTLLIVYYAGHGWAPPDEHDEMLLNGQQNNATSRVDYVKWHDAEATLARADGDVFAIFDCCNAGRVCQYRGAPVRFEILGACSADQVTEIPGEASFTRALIWALKKLRLKTDCTFPTSELQRTIKDAPKFPKDQQPPLAHRYAASPDHIIIAPYEKVDQKFASSEDLSLERTDSREGKDKLDISEYFDIRLHFSELITEERFILTADALKELIEKPTSALSIERISYLGSDSLIWANVRPHALWWLESTRLKKASPTRSEQEHDVEAISKLRMLKIPQNKSPAPVLDLPSSATSERSTCSMATTCVGEAGNGEFKDSSPTSERLTSKYNESAAQVKAEPALELAEGKKRPISEVEGRTPDSSCKKLKAVRVGRQSSVRN
ncbi:hypothetical protein BLS_010016 [Venturia inaequalis]|uniref:Peptidase C14 caspase domain-containing protein n=1 Tax=Venturia inaequalis TaxID=5025 RepID=A0A8H3VHU3_VENIN|nr:hypothetical protein BLS_010016 [Venturia inaequalis]KAE9988681.1 hypothetical protein EG328_008698 [Venturia inaequalis]KAE9990966.1 hypothetical protein EG327_000679 [Venturia inaequalis]